ncbi:MAG: hypothetical protein ACP5M5_04940, partial [Acidibrevibacterium sp.]|uniref:hypothetical protein n=1 Tax=Acidibrevibacterium sp. TaxID=2606776 RepID=UPI003CFF7B80
RRRTCFSADGCAHVHEQHVIDGLPRTGAVHAIKWAVQRPRDMTLESVGQLVDGPLISPSAVTR